jgi:hypothetical protein
MKKTIMNKRGVFWIIDGELITFPFDETSTEGVAKSGKTYNHKLLWEHIKPCNKPFDYYPRGRVEYNSKGKAIIYMKHSVWSLRAESALLPWFLIIRIHGIS